jgi:hypothetical protein
MYRAIGFRIVGFMFLAFAALTIYQGEFVLGRSGGVVISRAHDPDAFWRGVIIQIAAGCVALYFGRAAAKRAASSSAPSGADGRAESLTSAQFAEERPQLPNYDPDFCGRVVKGAAGICVGLIAAELVVLLLVHASDDRCPGWILHAHQPSAASLWVLAGMFAVLPALLICNIALRWDDHYARKVYDSLASGPPAQLLIDGNWVALIVMAFWCLFGAIPLALMLGQCTALSHYVDALHL